MRIGSLFSGYGGLDMGVQAVLGGEVAWHVEYDKAPSRILAHHWPDISNYGDVTTLDFSAIEPVDVLTGGYPCQPFSHAGKRKGTHDDRHLWPHVLRAIRDLGPSLAVLENVRGHLTLGFDIVLADLAGLGWSAEWGVVRASDAGAPHQRARLFIVAYPSSQRHGARQDAGGMGRLDGQDAGGTREWEWAREVAGDRGTAVVADAPEHGRPQRRSGSGERAGSAGQSPSNLCPAADTHLAGSQAWGDARQDGERLRVEPLGFAQPATDADLAGSQGRQSAGRHDVPAWGDYAPAIARWERVIGRPAPAPTEAGRTGAPRLSPAFVEWMMGLPAGWVTDPAIGISRNDQLKALGNGVVPQQAALALSLLMTQEAAA